MQIHASLCMYIFISISSYFFIFMEQRLQLSCNILCSKPRSQGFRMVRLIFLSLFSTSDLDVIRSHYWRSRLHYIPLLDRCDLSLNVCLILSSIQHFMISSALTTANSNLTSFPMCTVDWGEWSFLFLWVSDRAWLGENHLWWECVFGTN